MSRIYDDLKRGKSASRRSGDQRSDTLDLFSYAANRQAEQRPPPVQETTPPPPTEETEPNRPPEPAPEPVIEETAAPLFHRSVESGRPITSVLDPLTQGRVPLWADRDRKRRITITVIVALAVCVSILFAVVAAWTRRPRKEPVAETASVPIPEPPSRAERSAPVAQSRLQPPAPVSAAPATPAARTAEGLSLKAPGTIVKTQSDVRIVTFESGIFSGGVRLSPGGRRSLDAIGRQLAPYGKRLSITVIGCTDNIPINVGGRFENNQELGLARANEIAQHLQRTAKIPASSFQTVSYGERWAPYPNDTPENRAKNRTAVLRISVR